MAKPLLSATFTDWVAALPVERKPLLWCDECHCWHAHASHCPYHPDYTEAGA